MNTWVYWAPEGIRRLFEEFPGLGDVAQPRQGLATTNNSRFVRFWWEVDRGRIAFGCQNATEARASGRRWFAYMKGGEYRKWYGNQEHVVNWGQDGAEIKESIVYRYPYLNGKWGWVAKNTDYYFHEGLTWSDLSSKGFTVRYMPPGFVFDVSGSSGFPRTELLFTVMAVMNSLWMAVALALLNPTMHSQVGDVSRAPFKEPGRSQTEYLEPLARSAVRSRQCEAVMEETTFEFILTLRWDTGLSDLTASQARLEDVERRINEEAYVLYGISHADRAAMEAELAGGSLEAEEDEDAAPTDQDDESSAEAPMSREELAVRWISYAVGIVLGRFEPSVPGALGSGVYHSADFAVGSLPEPDEQEFDELVGPVERFAYVDGEGGRHLFPAQVEKALLELAVPDGIAVLDEGHPRDLPTLVQRALTLMLGEESAREVIAQGTSSNSSTPPRTRLRKFLERDFFTKWHLKWYRKRPVYWPMQSAQRSYGFLLFHEKVEHDTLYVLQRDYLDHKLNGLRLQINDIRTQLESKEGGARKQLEREMDDVTQMLDELSQFAEAMERAVREGYEPEPNWIDDGIILRLAPLWELIPIWKTEPKKHWERLQRGDFDWAHIAMHYWPDRVREKCKTDKSLAIAHGV